MTTTHTRPSKPRVLRWWREVIYILAFYGVYTTIRNTQGSETVSATHAFHNAVHVVDVERGLRLYFEEGLQDHFLRFKGFMQFWNVFYGTAHFIVTVVALVWLFRKLPGRYPQWRNTLACTTALALLGFATFALMPPRLLPSYCDDHPVECERSFDSDQDYDFVDSLKDIGGLWSFDSGTMQKISNQYAAMPSLHFAWSTWCVLVLLQLVRRRWLRALVVTYPALTLFAVVVTANHYWLDAAGGALVLTLGYLIGTEIARRVWQVPETARRAAPERDAA
jgi:PAP2 superfamily protein